MTLERLLQLSMALLASLGTIMLGLGERSPGLPLVATIAAFSSIYFTDLRGWIRLNHFGASLIAGAAAAGGALWDYWHFDRENQLLALANLLVYLQCILGFWEKNPRIYWMLAVLSLLQVAVATVLNSSLWFGMLLVIYLFVALAAVSALLVYREQWRFNAAAEQAAKGLAAPPPGDARRWSLLQQRNGFAPRLLPHAPRGFALSSYARQVLRMGLVSLVSCAVAFMLVPRTQQNAWGEAAGATQHTVGFNDGITLGEMGEIVDDPEQVIEMRFMDSQTNLPYALSEPPLLRGTTLVNYQRGKWRPTQMSSGLHAVPVWTQESSLKISDLVRQELVVDPLDTRTVFGVFPVYRDPEASVRDIEYDGLQDRLSRKQRSRPRAKIEYSLLTAGFRRGQQLPVFPRRGVSSTSSEPKDPRWKTPPETPRERDIYLVQLALPSDLPRLQALAQQIVKDIPAENTERRALTLERHLRDSGNYRYTVLPPPRDARVDPIEDFLFQNPQGHCEYFASALTLMCRSIGIPARMVVGFKGADWNPLRGTYHVRQMFAHAWVEVYLEPEQIPQPAFATWQHLEPGAELPVEWRHGGWLTLDPTPGVAGESFLPAGDRFPSLRHVLDYAEFLWSSYVLSMDAKRQEEAVFNPLQQGTSDMRSLLFNPDSWKRLFRNLLKILRGERPDDLGLWFSWPAALVTMLALATLVLLARLSRLVLGWLWPVTSKGGIEEGQAMGIEVEFYQRLEALLLQCSLVRPPGQTQREFAVLAGDQLAIDPQTLPVAALPRRIAEAFYRVRFGGAPLDNREAESVEQALAALAAGLHANRTTRK